MLAAALALSLGACRSSVTSPIAPTATLEAALVIPQAGPPVTAPLGIRSVRVSPYADNLVVAIQYVHPRSRVGYDPFTAGGWCFQVFLDTDQQPTGYLGYDFLTRDTEPDLAGREIRVRRTTGGDETTPGGWGDAVEVVPLMGGEDRVLFRIPLASLDDDDGRADYRVEFYRTVACPECPDGLSHEYVFHVTGTTTTFAPLAVRRDAGHRSGLLARIATALPSRPASPAR